jgi:uncharacterized iron-regulated protein
VPNPIRPTRPSRLVHLLVALSLSLAAQVQAKPESEGSSAQPHVQAAASGQDEILDTQTAVVDMTTLGDLAGLIDKLASRRLIFVGETHDRYEDHLNQLAIIDGLRLRGKDVAIGMEPFQQPFQGDLDAYIAGTIDEAELLRRSDYFERWRYDFRLYRPILRLARAHGIPVIALNLEREITEAVGDGGLEALDSAQRGRVPADLDRSDPDYVARVRAVFDAHPMTRDKDKAGDDEAAPEAAAAAAQARFERFLAVQLLWDEGMAERAAAYLQEHPEKTLVVLAGSGHLEYGQGIPNRVQRRIQVPAAVVLNGTGRDLNPRAADFLLFPRGIALPAAGLLGVLLDTESKGEGVAVKGFSEGSGAKAAGMEEADRIVRVGETAIAAYADLRIALVDSRPGQRIQVEVLRKPLFGSPDRVDLEVELH